MCGSQFSPSSWRGTLGIAGREDGVCAAASGAAVVAGDPRAGLQPGAHDSAGHQYVFGGHGPQVSRGKPRVSSGTPAPPRPLCEEDQGWPGPSSNLDSQGNARRACSKVNLVKFKETYSWGSSSRTAALARWGQSCNSPLLSLAYPTGLFCEHKACSRLGCMTQRRALMVGQRRSIVMESNIYVSPRILRIGHRIFAIVQLLFLSKRDFAQ